MIILHLIDTLHAGGAERMVVNLANGLLKRGLKVHVCASRETGVLSHELDDGIALLLLNRKSTFDLKAIFRLLVYLKKHKVTHLHAHGTSFFLGWMAAICYPKLKFIWHDHYGNAAFLGQRPKKVLKLCARRMNLILSVNHALVTYGKKVLKVNNTVYLSNFSPSAQNLIAVSQDVLKLNVPETFKIVMVANLRPQKDHLTLIKAFKIVKTKFDKVSLHIVGAPLDNDYAQSLQDYLGQQGIASIYFYGAEPQPQRLMAQADLGVLSSKSEGLPLTLLEYAHAGLPVVVTDVGACREVVQDHGLIVPAQNVDALADAISQMIQQPQERAQMAAAFQRHVQAIYDPEVIMDALINHYTQLN